MTGTAATADIGVFGGSGFYAFLDDIIEVEVDTPFGPPSAPVAIGTIADRRVAFLPRHGKQHQLPPHRVDFRANAWALHSLGVRSVVGPCAVGSLRADRRPGDLVVPDQLVDRTWGRPDTFADGGSAQVQHLSFADPYSEELRQAVLAAARQEHDPGRVHDGGTVVVIQGPRFSTRAESRWFRRMGWDVVNMTQHPEVALCRELGMAYAGMALVTDYDSGVDDRPDVAPVTMDEVFRVLAENVELTRRILVRAIPLMPTAGGTDGPARVL
ncbi:MAG: S-methyl-5'-thioadenosine phosphorylase [Acidimicrobiales bacterium]